MRLALLLLALLLVAPVHAQTFPAVQYGYVANPGVDNIGALQRAFDAALAGRQSGQVATVLLPPGVGGYQGELRIEADSLALRGCGGAVVTRDTLASGEFYFPVRQANLVDPELCVSVLRVLDGAMGRPQPTLRNEMVTRFSLKNDVRQRDGSIRRAHYFELRDVVLDGNEAGQMSAILSDIATGRAEDQYRNGPGHTALNATRNGGGDFSSDGPHTYDIGAGRTLTVQGSLPGLRVAVDHVVIRGYAATGLVADRASRWMLNTVRVQDSAYNHGLYNVDGGVFRSDLGVLSGWGGWTDVTVAGHAWTWIISDAGLAITRLVAEDLTRSPLGRDAGDVINARGGPVTVRGYTAAPSEAGWPRLFNNSGYDSATVQASPGPPVWVPTVVTAPAPPRYRVEPRRRCRDLRTGRYVSFARYCSSLAATPSASPHP